MKSYKYPNKVSFLKFILRSSTIAKNPIPFHKEMFQKSGESFSVKPLFSPKVILTKDANIARHILQKQHKNYEKSKLQTHFLSKYVGYGLLTSTGEYWLQQRRLIQPGFHREKIKDLVAIINGTINEQIVQIETDKLIELYPLMNTLAFEVVAKSLFDYSADSKTLKRLQGIIETLQKFIVKEIRQPHKRFLYSIRGEVKHSMKLVAESRKIINTIIEERRQSNQNHSDLLEMLLTAQYEDGSTMNNDQLIDEILILFVAGHETTANALTFTLFLLANHPSYLKKAQDESVDLRNNDHVLETLSNLPFIKACIEESMRLYPSAWITDRVALENDSVGDYYIKKGTLFGVSIYEMHRNPKYWKDPETFLPERFLGDQKYQAYMPFGAGPRLCIGNNFAMYEMLLAINSMVNAFTIKTNKPQIELNPLITLKPVGVEMKFIKRE